jgi:hypothetical protein
VAASLPNPGYQNSRQLLTRWDVRPTTSCLALPSLKMFIMLTYPQEQEDCENHGFRWDDQQKCCFDHDGKKWHDDDDNNEERHWERLQRKCEGKGNRWDNDQHCCFDKDNHKVDDDDDN